MNGHIYKKAAALVFGALMVLAPVLSQGMGLSGLRVHSALDEPLNAEIDFTSLSEKERRTLEVRLASREAFEAAGIDRPPNLTNIKFSIAKRGDGRYILQLQTDEPFREPFLHLLIRLDWAGGRMIREYTALIDPPYLVAGKPAGIQAPKTAPPVAEPAAPEAVTAPAPEPERVAAVPKPAPEPKAAEPVAEAAPGKPAPQPEPEPAPEPAVEPMAPAEAPVELLGPGEVGQVRIAGNGWPEEEAPAKEPYMEPLGPDVAGAPVPAGVTEEGYVPVATIGPSWTSGSDTYLVRRGDTMWEVVKRLRTDTSLSIEQIILAIYRTNQDAFFRNNVNNLRSGKILKLPDRETVTALSDREARKEFLAQYDVWQEHQMKLASARHALSLEDVEPDSAPVAAEPAAEPAPTAAAETAPKAAQAGAETKPEPKAKPKAKAKPQNEGIAPKSRQGTPADDLLKIVRANLEKEKAAADKAVPDSESRADPGRKEQAALAERVTSLEESLESKRMQTEELGNRVGQVKEQLEKQKRLIELESAELAQAGPEAKPGTPEAAKPSPAETKKPAAAAATATPKPVKPVKKPRVRPAPPAPQPEKGFIERLIDDFTGGPPVMPLLWGALGVMVLILGLIYLRRRRQAKMEFEESILNSAVDSEGGLTMDSGEASVEAGDTSFLSDFSQGGMGNISTDEVDPIAEAEVYLAYGRDEQAEEILKEAVVKDPSRHELKEKLLGIYHQRGDTAAFETLAEELYAALEGRGGELWERVAALGRDLNSGNPMFAGFGSAAAAAASEAPPEPDTGAATAETEEMSLDMEPPQRSETMLMPEQDTADSGDETMLDFDAEVAGEEEGAISMDASLDIAPDLDMPAEAEAPSAEDNVIDFNMETEGGEEAAPAGEEAAEGLDVGADLALDSGEGTVDFTLDGVDLGAEVEEESEKAASEAETVVAAKATEEDIQWDFETDAGDTGGGGEGLALETETAAGAMDELALDTEPDDTALAFEAEAAPDTSVAEDESEESVQWDETATKLDLAKAYIDMGDAEGARSILDEVLAEGNETQKRQAQELAAQIA